MRIVKQERFTYQHTLRPTDFSPAQLMCLSLSCVLAWTSNPTAHADRQRGEAPDAIRAPQDSSAAGGIAGIGYAEDFEVGFTPGSGCGQNGWSCGGAPGDFDIANVASEPAFETLSAIDTTNGTNIGLREMRSPLFTLETGIINADILITEGGILWQWTAFNNATGIFNTRISFASNGSILVLQPPAGGPPCAGGTFATTAGSWAPDIKMRIGIEVDAGNVLKVYKSGALIFTGQDISQTCAPASASIGIGQVSNYNSNADVFCQMIVDNIGTPAPVNPCELPLPACAADIAPSGGDGSVNILDMLEVINTWGQTQVPPGTGPRPPADCAPPPNGDCVVNINDLLSVINSWGACPP